ERCPYGRGQEESACPQRAPPRSRCARREVPANRRPSGLARTVGADGAAWTRTRDLPTMRTRQAGSPGRKAPYLQAVRRSARERIRGDWGRFGRIKAPDRGWCLFPPRSLARGIPDTPERFRVGPQWTAFEAVQRWDTAHVFARHRLSSRVASGIPPRPGDAGPDGPDHVHGPPDDLEPR